MFALPSFSKEFGLLWTCCSALAALSNLACRAIRYIVNKCQAVEKVEQVAHSAMLKSETNSASPSAQTEEARDAAIKIQRSYRVYVARLALRKMKTEDSRARAAIKIQSACRGYLTRLKVKKASKHLLSYALFAQGKRYADCSANLASLPLATSGTTPVYLPQDAAIVLKSCGAFRAQERLEKMRQALAFCEKNAYAHLVIAQARVCGNFIIEARLPIASDGLKEQICLYMENSGRFTAAVQDFAGFMLQATLLDTTGYLPNPYGIDSETYYGRYDNISLYLEGNEGKIGLVDLETFFQPTYPSRSGRIVLEICRDLVRLFPLHLGEILATVQKISSGVSGLKQELKKEQERVLKFFDKVYTSHCWFLSGKGITNADAQKIIEPTEQRKNEITKVLTAAFNEENDAGADRNSLLARCASIPDVFEKKIPAIVEFITTFLKDSLIVNIQNVRQLTSSYDQLALVRTLLFNDSNPFYVRLQQSVAKELLELNLGNEDLHGEFAGLVIQTIFKELEKGGEIAYYNPKACSYKGSGRYVSQQCIFC